MKVKTSPEEKPKKRGGIQPRNRTKYSAAQLNTMESLFLVSQYPDSQALEELAKSLAVSVERISIWFQNRRSKFKRQSKDVHMAWMRKQIFNQDSPRPNPLNMILPPTSSSSSSSTTSPNQSISQSTSQSTSPDKSCHVLSPPVEDASPSNSPPYVKFHPRSNLHYMPENLYYPGTATSTYNSNNNNTTATSSQPSYSTQNHLLMSHLLNDVTTTTAAASYQQQQQQQSCNYGNYQNNNYSNLYNNYPYYSQMSSYYSLNNSSNNLYSSSSSTQPQQLQSSGF